MAINLIQELEQTTGFQRLLPVDPNTQDIAEKENLSGEQRIGQAAIPAVLLGFYIMSRSPEGLDVLKRGNDSTEWEKIIFKNKEEQVIDRISEYSSENKSNVQGKINLIITQMVDILKNKLTPDDIDNAFVENQHVILNHLPGSLQIGKLLGDGTKDDPTHKMDGPISTLMHNIAKGFS